MKRKITLKKLFDNLETMNYNNAVWMFFDIFGKFLEHCYDVLKDGVVNDFYLSETRNHVVSYTYIFVKDNKTIFVVGNLDFDGDYTIVITQPAKYDLNFSGNCSKPCFQEVVEKKEKKNGNREEVE